MYAAGFVIPVPEEKMEACRKWAEDGAAIFREYGCLEIVECWEDNVPDGKYTDFRCGGWNLQETLAQRSLLGRQRLTMRQPYGALC